MGNFRRDGGNRFGGDRGDRFEKRGGGGRDFHRGGPGGRDRGPITMHQATCDQCQKPCEVPFRPTQGKPVYCSDCFEGKKDSGNNRGGDRFPRKSFDNFKTSDRSDTGNNFAKANNNDDVKKQLEILNAKMDRLIKAVEVLAPVKPLVADKKVKEEKKEIPVARVKKILKRVSKKK